MIELRDLAELYRDWVGQSESNSEEPSGGTEVRMAKHKKIERKREIERKRRRREKRLKERAKVGQSGGSRS
jgi:hypothetical protein